jgi:hypothetical protein
VAQLLWDQTGERVFETGVDHGVLFIPDSNGAYSTGVAWNGLVTVTESPSGAESNKQYADNQVYLNLISAEEFGATIEAFTYPDAFAQCDGTATPSPGVFVGQQSRRSFGLVYRTRVGNDVEGTDAGYKLHLNSAATAAPSERAFGTINDSPEAITFSWDLTTSPVQVTGFKPTASLTLDSTKVDAGALSNLEDLLFGTVGEDPRLPLPDEVLALFTGTVTTVTPVAPTYDAGTHTITIPTVTGVRYTINGQTVTGNRVITQDTVVNAHPTAGNRFPDVTDDDWFYDYV